MKSLLMVPLTGFIEEPPNIPDLGLGYIARYLTVNGYEVYIRDWNMNPSVRDFRNWLNVNKPEVIGIKVFTKDVKATKKTISIIRDTLPRTFVVIGGPHPSAADPVDLMEDFPECDFAIKGEAETSFPALIAMIMQRDTRKQNNPLSKKKLKEIPGLVWRDQKQILSNSISLISDLDRIDLPCWEMIDPNNYNTHMFGPMKEEGVIAPIVTSRGCPGKCSFCAAYKVSGRKIRFRSPLNIFEEMLMLYKKYNVRKFMFVDNCFISIKENLLELSELIVKSEMDIEWDCVSYQRLANLTKKTLPLMHRAGCRMLHMGIESGSEKIRKMMNKTSTLGEITDKIRLLKRNDIKVGAWFMVGFPGETKKEMKETIKYAFSIDADLITFTIVFPLPGTEIYNHLKEKYGFQRIDWSNFDIHSSMYPASCLSSKRLSRLLKVIRFRIRMKTEFKRAVRLLGRK